MQTFDELLFDKIVAAKKFAVGSEGAAEGGCGGEFRRTRANTERGQPRRPAR